MGMAMGKVKGTEPLPPLCGESRDLEPWMLEQFLEEVEEQRNLLWNEVTGRGNAPKELNRDKRGRLPIPQS